MARIRTIKPDFWTDDKILELSIPARLLFIGLWTYADDNGVLQLKTKQLKARIFPGDSIDINPLLIELEAEDLIMAYQVDGQNYIMVKNFRKHQLIYKPRKSSLPLPPPEAGQMNSAEISGNKLISAEISGNKLISAEISGKNIISAEILPGKEGKGKEGKVHTSTNLDLEINLGGGTGGGITSPKTTTSPANGNATAVPPADSVSDTISLKSPTKSPKSAPTPFQAIIDLWNTHAPPLLPRASLTDRRRPKIKAAWREYPSLDWWRELFADIALSPWHSHQGSWQGNSIDWVVKNRTELREKLDAIKSAGQIGASYGGHTTTIEPDPPGIMIPLPNCPDCGGRGLTKDGPCHCLHPENPDDPYWQEHPEELDMFKVGRKTPKPHVSS